MRAISLDSAILVTGLSKRTLWRRLTDGSITRMEKDSRGRAMLAFEDLIPLLSVPVAPEDYLLFIAADAGDAGAQNDLALLFLEVGQPEVARHWLEAAANTQRPDASSDAMHNLAHLYLSGTGVSRNEHLGLMWLAKAAARGYVIAERQMAALVQGSVKDSVQDSMKGSVQTAS